MGLLNHFYFHQIGDLNKVEMEDKEMKKNRLRTVSAVALALVLGLSSLVSASASGSADQVNPVSQEKNVVEVKELTAEEKAVLEFKEEVVRLVNLERAKLGANALRSMDLLADASDVRARESAQSFSHTRLNKTRFFTVLADFSLTYRATGENLAYGFKTPEALVKAWMNSPSHKANIVNPIFTDIGIGYHKNANGRIYVSQLFYTPMPTPPEVAAK